MPAVIRVDQLTGAGEGVAGVSRNDLWKEKPVQLTDVGGNTAWRWSLISKPEGSVAVLTGADTATATFTPDLSGDYKIKLVINTSGVTKYTTVRVRNADDGQPVRRGWTLPGFGALWAQGEISTGASITVTPTGNIVATSVQGALAELDAEKGGLALNNNWIGSNTWNPSSGANTFNVSTVFNDAATLNSATTVNGVITFNGTSTFNGPVVLNELADFLNGADVNGNFNWSGPACTFTGDVTFGGGISDTFGCSLRTFFNAGAEIDKDAVLLGSVGLSRELLLDVDAILGVDVFESRVPQITANRIYTLPAPQFLHQRRRFSRIRTGDAFSATLRRNDATIMGFVAALGQGWVEVYAFGTGLNDWVVSAWGGVISVNTTIV